ncbi:MAG TPA: HAD family phosphatase [Myxococcota bacterium]|nr:HAD family phosphatase [Myxococcota bacterium]
MAYRAVLFDLGGVVLDSPLHAIAHFERDQGIPEGFVNRVVASTGSEGAWGRLERGHIGIASFVPAFEAECAAAGRRLSARALMEQIGRVAQPRAPMLSAIRRIRSRGLLAAALTNNWPSEEPDAGGDSLRSHFDAFFESSALGLHKPDPRIYEHACSALAIRPADAVFLDDIGRNLKAARALGMTTIRVVEPCTALAELEGVLGFPLLDRSS